MTARVTFYDLPPDGRWPLLARLVAGAWQKRRATTLRCADAETAQRLSEYLWITPEDAFIPHEVAAPDRPLLDALARIVLVTSEHTPLAPEVLLCEAPSSLDFAASFEHVVDLVDHRSPEALAASRDRFRAWRERGIVPEVRKEGP